MRNTRSITRSAMVGALYFAIAHLQHLLLPGSGSWAVQFRLAEALCVAACFTPDAIGGLTVGCALFNFSAAGSLPLDFLVGGLATWLAATGMWRWRRLRLWGVPVLALSLPALTNGLLVGWEVTVYLGDTGFTAQAFAANAALVALGELGVLFTLGLSLYRRRAAFESHRIL